MMVMDRARKMWAISGRDCLLDFSALPGNLFAHCFTHLFNFNSPLMVGVSDKVVDHCIYSHIVKTENKYIDGVYRVQDLDTLRHAHID